MTLRPLTLACTLACAGALCSAVQAAGPRIAVGADFVLVSRTDGTVWAWGQGVDGQLGNGLRTSSSHPVQVTGLSGVVDVVAADSLAAALKADGTVWVWGHGANGIFGSTRPDNTIRASTPVMMPQLSEVHALALGHDGAAGFAADSRGPRLPLGQQLPWPGGRRHGQQQRRRAQGAAAGARAGRRGGAGGRRRRLHGRCLWRRVSAWGANEAGALGVAQRARAAARRWRCSRWRVCPTCWAWRPWTSTTTPGSPSSAMAAWPAGAPTAAGRPAVARWTSTPCVDRAAHRGRAGRCAGPGRPAPRMRCSSTARARCWVAANSQRQLGDGSTTGADSARPGPAALRPVGAGGGRGRRAQHQRRGGAGRQRVGVGAGCRRARRLMAAGRRHRVRCSRRRSGGGGQRRRGLQRRCRRPGCRAVHGHPDRALSRATVTWACRRCRPTSGARHASTWPRCCPTAACTCTATPVAGSSYAGGSLPVFMSGCCHATSPPLFRDLDLPARPGQAAAGLRPGQQRRPGRQPTCWRAALGAALTPGRLNGSTNRPMPSARRLRLAAAHLQHLAPAAVHAHRGQRAAPHAAGVDAQQVGAVQISPSVLQWPKAIGLALRWRGPARRTRA
jgi:hypothetical protein